MMDELIRWPGALVCAAVLVGCICRIDRMRHGETKFAWFLCYAMLAGYACGVMLDLLLGYRVDWYELLGIGGVMMDLVMTWRAWSKGPPRCAQSRPAPLGKH